MDEILAKIDKSSFDHKPFAQRLKKPWGYELHLTSPQSPYMAKILHINAGKRISLQAHDQKVETWVLKSGQVMMILEDKLGRLAKIPMKPQVGYTTKLGQKHRLIAITDCEVFESSTPEIGNTIRIEDDYKRPTETEEMRKDPNRGWNPN